MHSSRDHGPCPRDRPGRRVLAQLPLIRLDHTFPLGAEAGSTIVLEISGKDLDDVTELRFDHPGLRAERIKADAFRVTIAAKVPRGTDQYRAVGKHGISAAGSSSSTGACTRT